MRATRGRRYRLPSGGLRLINCRNFRVYEWECAGSLGCDDKDPTCRAAFFAPSRIAHDAVPLNPDAIRGRDLPEFAYALTWEVDCVPLRKLPPAVGFEAPERLSSSPVPVKISGSGRWGPEVLR